MTELIGAGTDSAVSRQRSRDAATVLGLFALLLFVLPARAVVAPAGALGRPAILLGLAMFVWWSATRAVPGLTPQRPSRLASLLLVFGTSALLSYAAGHLRFLDPLEVGAADRFVALFVAFSGVALTAADGLSSLKRVHSIVCAVIAGASFMAAVATLQFAGYDITLRLVPPGLSLNRQLLAVAARDGTNFDRVPSTTFHYIEFGVIMAMALPLALHVALYASTRARSQWSWIAVGLIGAATAFSVSRSAVLGVLVGVGTLALVWTARLRIRALLIALVAVAAFQVITPGLLGTLKGLFLNATTDTSVTARTQDYGVIAEYFAERPLLGLGSGVFIPPKYIVLDNQFLVTLVTQGLIGVAVLLLLFGCAIGASRAAAKDAATTEVRHLGQALTASILVAMVSSATFDSLSFTTFYGFLMLLIGIAFALRRLTVNPLAEEPNRSMAAGRREQADALVRSRRVRR